MGMLVDGKWTEGWINTKSTGGQFKRKESQFRNWITTDGSSQFAPEPNRYHLYVSLACPWAHRTLIVRKLKKLEDIISVSVVHWFAGDQGWEFAEGPGCTPDSVNNAQYLHQVYTLADPAYTGRVTVPVLWDKKLKTIVNNESSEIIRMLNTEFDEYGDTRLNLYPDESQDEIDEINALIYDTVNNGVYKSGFATTQEAYEEAVTALFKTLDMLEKRLGQQPYLVGDQLTEADWRLFTTLIRFDPVYVGHFKCNRRRIVDYPALSTYLRKLYWVPGVAETVNLLHIKNHYYQSHESVNPTRIVPVGPELDWMEEI
ncbi:glutathione S-transferase family protein [Chloroflexi bacterium TSY]|nr:glutathione S-transferase family protein [Chloroflexi bacterium TSY]